MNLNDKIKLTTILLLCLSSTSINATDSSQREQIETLFRLTNMEKRINESVESVVQLQLRQNPSIIEKKDTLANFINKYIGWQAMKEDIIGMYTNTFSIDELKTINAFYITPAGQKVINTVPLLVQQRNKLAMQRLQKNIGELQKIMGSNH